MLRASVVGNLSKGCPDLSYIELTPTVPKTLKGTWASALNRTENRQELYDSWRSVTEIFSLFFLTYPTDTVAAISGLARYVAQVTNDEYIAGLWRGDLIYGLTWGLQNESDAPIAQSHNQVAYHPSWSWVVPRRRPVVYTFNNTKASLKTPLVTIFAAKTYPLDDGEPFGRRRGGYIYLTGLLVTSIPEELANFIQWEVGPPGDEWFGLPMATFDWLFAGSSEMCRVVKGIVLNKSRRGERTFSRVASFSFRIHRVGEGHDDGPEGWGLEARLEYTRETITLM